MSYKDGLFGSYWRALDDLPAEKKLLRGAYHFLSSDAKGAAQADTFLQALENNGGLKTTDMPPVVDLEWDITQSDRNDRWRSHSPQEILDVTLAWLKVRGRKKPAVYLSSTLREAGGTSAEFLEEDINQLSHYRIWIADYSVSARAIETPSMINHSRWHLWQFTERAKLSQGYDGPVDANIYKGTEDQFAEDFGPK